MNPASKLQAFCDLCQKHYNAIRAERGNPVFITSEDHEEMAREAKRLAIAEINAA